MAVSKNNSSTVSNADSTGGFKTVAFGFDKNDVTLYIASLRKKMKQMEEEFQDKLREALDNPAASNEALKHEREVIRSEMEAMWGDKLNERNQILKQQQSRINELERSLNEKEGIIDALKAEVSASNAESEDGGASNQRAARAYVQFTTEIRNITSSLQNTLRDVERTWRGEFEDSISEIEAAEAEKLQRIAALRAQQEAAAAALTSAPTAAAAPAPVSPAPVAPAPTAVQEPAQETAPEAVMPDTESEAAKKKAKPSKKPAAPEPVKIPLEPFDFGDEEDDPLKGIIADISDDTPKVAPIATPELVKAKKPEPEKVIDDTPVEEPIAEEPIVNEPIVNKPTVEEPIAEEPAVEEEAADISDIAEIIEEPAADGLDDFGDLGDLLAEPVPKPAPVKKAAAPAPVKNAAAPARKAPPAPKIEVDDDLSALLADDPSDNDIKAEDEIVGATDDFADLLAEDNSNKPGFGEGILIAEDESAAVKGDDLDVSLLSDMVIVPGDKSNGDLDRMLKEQEANEYAQFGDLFVAPASDEETIGFQSIGAVDSEEESDLFSKPIAPKKAEKEDDLFDFSFLGSDTDEDDMSTDASFPGML